MVFIFCDSSYPGCKSFVAGVEYVTVGNDEFGATTKALVMKDDVVKLFYSKKDAEQFINENYKPWSTDCFVRSQLRILSISHLYECQRKIFASNLKWKQFSGGS